MPKWKLEEQMSYVESRKLLPYGWRPCSYTLIVGHYSDSMRIEIHGVRSVHGANVHS